MFVLADNRITLSKVVLLVCQGKMEKPYTCERMSRRGQLPDQMLAETGFPNPLPLPH